MAPQLIYVAIWTLRTGKIVPTLTTESIYRKWQADRMNFAEKRIHRWNSPNRKVRRLEPAVGYYVEKYIRSLSGPAIAVGR